MIHEEPDTPARAGAREPRDGAAHGSTREAKSAARIRGSPPSLTAARRRGDGWAAEDRHTRVRTCTRRQARSPDPSPQPQSQTTTVPEPKSSLELGTQVDPSPRRLPAGGGDRRPVTGGRDRHARAVAGAPGPMPKRLVAVSTFFFLPILNRVPKPV
jgi:hypothetical protein